MDSGFSAVGEMLTAEPQNDGLYDSNFEIALLKILDPAACRSAKGW
jgi:hypothetical protein